MKNILETNYFVHFDDFGDFDREFLRAQTKFAILAPTLVTRGLEYFTSES